MIIKKNIFRSKKFAHARKSNRGSKASSARASIPFFFFLSIQIPAYDLIPGREEGGGQTHREFLSSPVAGRRVLQALFSARRRAHSHDARPRIYTHVDRI